MFKRFTVQCSHGRKKVSVALKELTPCKIHNNIKDKVAKIIVLITANFQLEQDQLRLRRINTEEYPGSIPFILNSPVPIKSWTVSTIVRLSPERMGPLGKPPALPRSSTLSRTSSRLRAVTLLLSEPQ